MPIAEVVVPNINEIPNNTGYIDAGGTTSEVKSKSKPIEITVPGNIDINLMINVN